MQSLKYYLDKTSEHHDHLCPRQVLGVRMGLAGISVLGLPPEQTGKRLLIILECDGCFVDGVSAVTGCTVGHRTLCVEDYGKTAVTFVDTELGKAVRISPRIDLREQAILAEAEEPDHYQAMLKAYQVLPDVDMFIMNEVQLHERISSLVSQPGMRVSCESCGEEIMNEREINAGGKILCLPCAGKSYCSIGEVVSPENQFSAKVND